LTTQPDGHKEETTQSCLLSPEDLPAAGVVVAGTFSVYRSFTVDGPAGRPDMSLFRIGPSASGSGSPKASRWSSSGTGNSRGTSPPWTTSRGGRSPR
jgi:hypothetical protein